MDSRVSNVPIVPAPAARSKREARAPETAGTVGTRSLERRAAPGTAAPTRAAIIAEARSWIGTPWIHQGRLKGVACDCVGMIICVARALGIFPADLDATYSRNPQPKLMIDYLNQYLDRIDGAPEPADVLLLRPHRITQHLGILTGDNSFIHAIDRQRGVREHSLDARWRRAIVGVWRYRNLEDK